MQLNFLKIKQKVWLVYNDRRNCIFNFDIYIKDKIFSYIIKKILMYLLYFINYINNLYTAHKKITWIKKKPF